ncbi:SPOR domain-containing protein [Persephonella sp.]
MKKILIIVAGFLIATMFSCAPKVQEEKLPQNAEYYYKIGLSYLNSGNNSQALYYLNKAYRITPEDPDILNALGIAYSNVGELEKAKEFFLKAIEKDPDRAETYTNLGTLLAKQKNYEKALWYFKKAAENPSYMKKDIAYYNMALIYKNIGNLKLYEEYLKKAISYNTFLLPAYISLGNFYLEQKRYQDALSVFLTAKDKGLVSPHINIGLAKIYIHLKDYQKAKEYLHKAKNLARNNDFLLIEINRLLSLVDKKIIQETEEKIKEKEKAEEKKIKTVAIPEESKKPTDQKKEILEKPEEKIQEQQIAKKLIPEKKKKVIKPNIRFYVLVGRFTDQKKALDISEKLKMKGFNPEIKEEIIDGSPVYSVIIGYFKEYREASRFYRKNLKPLGLRGIVKFTRK